MFVRVISLFIVLGMFAQGDPVQRYPIRPTGIVPPLDGDHVGVDAQLYRRMVEATFDEDAREWLEKSGKVEEAPFPVYAQPVGLAEADVFALQIVEQFRRQAFIPEWPTVIQILKSQSSDIASAYSVTEGKKLIPFLAEISEMLNAYPTPMLFGKSSLRDAQRLLHETTMRIEAGHTISPEELGKLEALSDFFPFWESLEKVSHARFKKTDGKLFHVIGSRYLTKELHWVIEVLESYGIPTAVKRWDRVFEDQTADKAVEIAEQRAASDLSAIIMEESKNFPELKKFGDVVANRTLLQKIRFGIRTWFGNPRGIWLTPYLSATTGIRREASYKVADFIVSSVIAGVVSVVVLQESIDKLGGNLTDANILAGATIAFSWRLLFGFFKRASTQFHKMGVDYRHDLGTVAPHAVWTYFSMFAFGLMSTATYKFAVNGGHFGGADLKDTLLSSALNCFAKQLPTSLLHALEKREMPWVTIFFQNATQVALEYLRYSVALGYDKSPVQTIVFASLAVSGITLQILQHFFYKADAYSEIEGEGNYWITRTFDRVVKYVGKLRDTGLKRWNKNLQGLRDWWKGRVEPMNYWEMRTPHPNHPASCEITADRLAS